jgi:hypothetical protein
LGFSLAGQGASDYSDSLELLYKEEELRKGEAIIEGQANFPELSFAASWTQIAKEHDKLLQIYDTLNTIKAAWKPNSKI